MDAGDPPVGKRDEPFARDLTEQLQRVPRPSPAAAGGHVDDAVLASYLERRLTESELESVEAHLESCPSCRELAVESALALDIADPAAAAATEATAQEARVIPLERRPQGLALRWLAAAAVLTLVVLGAYLARQSGGRAESRLAALGVDAELLAAIEQPLADAARDAASGRWASSGAFEPYRLDSGGSQLRTGSRAATPQPMAPKWSAVRSTRPLFSWSEPRRGASEHEIFVVDDREALTARWHPAVSREGGVQEAAYSAQQPALEPGRTYFWKVNARVEGEPVASAYVPFRVLAEAEVRRLDSALEGLARSPFLRAVVLARHDLRDEALAELARAPGGGELARELAATWELPWLQSTPATEQDTGPP